MWTFTRDRKLLNAIWLTILAIALITGAILFAELRFCPTTVDICSGRTMADGQRRACSESTLQTNHASTDKKDRTAPVNLTYRVSVFSMGPKGRFAFLQSVDRPLSRKCLRNSILRRHIRLLLDSSHPEVEGLCPPGRGLLSGIRNTIRFSKLFFDSQPSMAITSFGYGICRDCASFAQTAAEQIPVLG
jgi:hypothetical protein